VPATRRRFDAEFRAGAVRIVQETGRPIAQVARELGISETTLGQWVKKVPGGMPGPGMGAPGAAGRVLGAGHSATDVLGSDERAELARLRAENAELRMECDALRRSMARWVRKAMRPVARMSL
jgi:transposase